MWLRLLSCVQLLTIHLLVKATSVLVLSPWSVGSFNHELTYCLPSNTTTKCLSERLKCP